MGSLIGLWIDASAILRESLVDSMRTCTCWLAKEAVKDCWAIDNLITGHIDILVLLVVRAEVERRWSEIPRLVMYGNAARDLVEGVRIGPVRQFGWGRRSNSEGLRRGRR